jgi:hypothetical protein
MAKRCTLCKCAAVHELYGFPVCEYHKTHTEDDPSCPKCNHPPQGSKYFGLTKTEESTIEEILRTDYDSAFQAQLARQRVLEIFAKQQQALKAIGDADFSYTMYINDIVEQSNRRMLYKLAELDCMIEGVEL